MATKFWQSGEYTANSTTTNNAKINIPESVIEAQAPNNGRVTGMKVKLYVKHHGTAGSTGHHSLYLSGNTGTKLSSSNGEISTSYYEFDNITVPCDANGYINGNLVVECGIIAFLSIKWTAKIEVTWTYTDAYTVTWENYDGNVLETDSNVASGTTPTYNGSTPTRAADETYTYSFDGWLPTVGAITGDTTYTATYTATKRTYEVTTESQPSLEAGYVVISPHGGPFNYADAVTLRAEANEGYRFVKWGDNATDNPRVIAIAGDRHLVAVFELKPPEITKVEMLYSGKQISKDNKVLCGEKFVISVELN